jgi:hypothetical protein
MSESMSKFRRTVRTLAPWFLVWVLNVFMFLPSYLFSQPRAAFWPPVHLAHAHGFVRPLVSFMLRRDNLDVFRISFDFGLLVLLAVASAGTSWRAPLRALIVSVYVWLVIFLTYHHSLAFFFARAPALGEDWRFLLNLGHFLGSVMSARWFAICFSVAFGLVGLALMAAYTFRAVQRATAAWSLRRRATFSLAFLVPCIAMLAWLGVSRDTPFVQISSKRVVDNWRSSQLEAARLAELDEPVPDRRYDPFLQLSLARKPNVYLLMIEAYGEILSTWDMDAAYRALAKRVEGRLSAAGYYARSAYSASPVHSGTSWFAISTVSTGALIDRPVPYDALQLVGARVPSMRSFFESQGYRTYALQPGNGDHAGLRRLDLFNHDVVVDATALAYPGWHYGWGLIPDQYSWMRFRNEWFKDPPSPHYVFYMCVSTHWDWGEGVPPYVDDPRTLERDEIQPNARDPKWPPFIEGESIGTQLRRSYFRSVEYEWRVLLDVLEADHSPDIVVAIVGDHQPRLEADVPGEVTMNTPIHIVSRDRAFVESFADAGFQPGIYAAPHLHPPLYHEGLFSLWVSKLTAAYGAPGSPAVPVYPRGIRLSTIKR